MIEKSGSQKVESAPRESASKLIDARIEELGDWRGEMPSRLREGSENYDSRRRGAEHF